ncbi:hypothetical protein WA026_018296 [Henosepilachna vigintioctopunctata]|uniref:Ionotropic glutamate receptor C-terminal domain-containing protein n=1 Tax=Henosepilachna vigintioctopunctata TaxID=420089 RepID=A0AAW1VIB5_9CUCU
MFCKNEDEFEMWTHNYIGLKDMNSLKFLDTWYTKNESFLLSKDLYPDKLTSQSGRKLTLTCIRYLPYVLCDEDKTHDRYYGTELRAAVEYAVAHNMTIDFTYNEHKEELWGELYSNWTGTGVMGNIILDKADIALASFETWDFVNPYLDMSAPYLRSSICCLVPRPENFSGWLIPLLSYTNWLWIAILLNFVYNVVTLALINYYYEKKNGFNLKIFSRILMKSFWVLLRISLSQVIMKKFSKHKYSPVRIVILVLFLMYSILDSTFFSGLASTMTTPRTHPPINTVAELGQHNINIYALSDAWKFNIQKADDMLMLLMIIYRDVIENYHLMEEDIFWDYTRFYFRKSSILTPSFDRFITRLTEVGIPARWQAEAIFKFMDSTLQRMLLTLEKQKKPHRDVLKLKIFHVKGAFALLFIGYTIAGVTLLVEIWYYYYNGQQITKANITRHFSVKMN